MTGRDHGEIKYHADVMIFLVTRKRLKEIASPHQFADQKQNFFVVAYGNFVSIS